MANGSRVPPVFPLSKLAEYAGTASSTRRRSLVRGQLRQAVDASDVRRWWYSEARAQIRKFLRTPATTRHDLRRSANQLRDQAADEVKQSKKEALLASARAIEALMPVAESLRSGSAVATAAKRHDAAVHRGNVRIVVAPDILFLERGTEHVVGALKLHASQENRLDSEALLNAACLLFTYLEEHGDRPARQHCIMVDVFTPAFEGAPARMKRRLQALDAACEEIEGWWDSMYDQVLAEAQSRRPQEGCNPPIGRSLEQARPH